MKAREQQETVDQAWWLKSAAFVVLLVLVVGYLGYKRSVALEYSIVGKPQNLAESVAETKRLDELRDDNWQPKKQHEVHSQEDRDSLTSLIEGAL
jgi:hypothetical protein